MATIAEEEKKKRGNFGDAAAAALDAEVTQPKYGKPGDFPVNADGTAMQRLGIGPTSAAAAAPSLPADGGAAFVPPSMGRRPAQVAQAPVQAPIPATQRLGWRTDAVVDGAAGDAQAAFSKGNYGETAGTLVRGAAAAVPAAFVDFGEGLAGGVVPAAKGFWRGLTGGDSPAPAAAVPSTSAAKAAPVVAPAAAAAPKAQAQPAAPAGPDGSPLVTDVGFGTRRIDVPGKAPLFTNVADPADNAALMARGSVSPQNMAAAQGLSDRYAAEASKAEKQAQYNQEVATAAAINARPIPANTGGFGLLSKEYQDRRDASFAPAGLVGDAAQNTAILSQNAALDTQATHGLDNAARSADLAGREKNVNSIATMDEQGRNSRFGMTNKLESQKLANEETKLGFSNRAAAQLQSLNDQILKETDPAKLQVLQDKAESILGRYRRPEAANKFTVVPGGQAIDDKTGVAYTVPARVIDNQSGKFVEPGPAPQGKPQQYDTTKIYQDANGNQAKWDGTKFVPIK